MSTGFLAHLSLENSVYLEDYDFKNCQQLKAILSASDAESYLLYPSIDARPLSSLSQSVTTHSAKKINIVVIEGTWSQARVILAKSKMLNMLPHIKLHHARTIEAIGYALSDLGDFTAAGTEEFLNPFLTLVERQIDFQKINSPRYRRKWEQSS
jgi:hypothetical protein